MAFLRTSAADLRVIVALVVFALASAPSVTRAEPTSTEEEHAQRLFDEGLHLLEIGSYAEACVKLEQSHALDPAGGTALDIGFCHEKQGNLATALAAYEDALRRAIDEGRRPREELARARIAELSRRVSKIRVRVSGASSATVTLDNRDLSSDESAAPIPVDSGTHEVRASAPGKVTVSREIQVIDEGVVFDVELALADEPRSVANAPPSAAADAQEVRVGPARPSAPASGAKQRWRGIGLGGGGLAVVGAGAALGLLAMERHAESDRLCPGGACTRAGVDAERSADALAWAANAAFVAGAVLVGVGVYLFVTAPRPATQPNANLLPRGLTVSF